MRLKTEIWVKAYVRRMATTGAFAAVVRHGDDDLGAVFIKVNRLDGTAILLGPAPEPMRFDAAASERRFVRLHTAEAIPETAAEAELARQRDFDADLWIVEIEDRAGRHGLDDALAAR